MTAGLLDLDGQVVGRQRELTQLDGTLEAAGQHGGECALLSGLPGVGKSTLIQVFGGEVAQRQGVFAYGRYHEGTNTPYAAWRAALGTLLRSMASTGPAERDRWRADLHRGMSTMADALRPLVPDLDAVIDTAPVATDLDMPTDLDAVDGRHRLQRAAARLVGITASYRPVVLAIDDLQWADRDALLLMSEMLAASIRNVVLLGAHRAGEFDPAAMNVDSSRVRTIDLEGRPERPGHQFGRLLGGGHGVGQIELAADAGQRAEHGGIGARQLVDGAAEQLGHVGGDLEGGECGQVPDHSLVGTRSAQCTLALRPVQQLANLQGIASGAVVELRGDVAQLHPAATDLSQQHLEIGHRQGLELHPGHRA